MKDKLVTFKGINEGIYINVEGSDFEAIKSDLDYKLQDTLEFYKDTKLLGIKSRELSNEELIELKYILKYKYNLIISEEELPSFLLDIKDSNEEKNKDLEEGIIFDGIKEGMTRFFQGTLRSGQVICYDGNVVIIGDVNPGALIEADGNIIVFGTLRGVAHAGKDGNYKSIVASYNLAPTQLRIANKIARSPDEVIKNAMLPEIASIKDGELVIEPYLPNK